MRRRKRGTWECDKTWHTLRFPNFWKVRERNYLVHHFVPQHWHKAWLIKSINTYRTKVEKMEVELDVPSQAYNKYWLLMCAHISTIHVWRKNVCLLLNTGHSQKASAFTYTSKPTWLLDWVSNCLLDVFHPNTSLDMVEASLRYLLISSKLKCKCNRKLEYYPFSVWVKQ